MAALRNKLSLLFAALAIIPCLTLSWLLSRQLTGAIELWSNPGVQDSVTHAVSAARLTMRVLEDRLSDSVQTAIQNPTAPHPELDLWRLYVRHGDKFILELAEASDTGTIVTPALLKEALEPGHSRLATLEAAGSGWLLAVAPLDSAASRVAVGGYKVPIELLTHIDAAKQGARLFARLEPYTELSKGWVLLSAGALTIALLGCAVILGRSLARGVTRPIERLVGAMRRLGRGETVERLTPPKDAEMRYLVESFNAMAGELTESRARLQRAERVAAWRDVARRVAHEIANPLTPIQFAIHRLKRQSQDPSADPAAIQAGLDSIHGEVESLKAISQAFSTLAKLPEPTMARVDLGALLEEVAELYTADGVTLELTIDPKLQAIEGDAAQLRQVFNNLLQNALDAMPSGGRLSVRATAAGRRVVVQVDDTGVGLPAGRGGLIWEPYVTTKSQGSGIGLAVVAKIIADHGGEVTLENRTGGDGQVGGARATVTLPEMAGTQGSGGRRSASTSVAASTLVLGALTAAILLTSAIAWAGPQPYTSGGGEVGPDILVHQLSQLLPDGWEVAERREGALPFRWQGTEDAFAVKLEHSAVQIHHPKGFTYHPFIRLYFFQDPWDGAMEELDYHGSVEPAYLLGANHLFQVFYQARAVTGWDDALADISQALDLSRPPVNRNVQGVVDRRLQLRLAERVMSMTNDLRDDALDRILGIARHGSLIYVEYVASIAKPAAQAGAPPLPASIRTLVDEESQALAEQVFGAFPEVSGVYMRRVCDNRLFDATFERSGHARRASAAVTAPTP